MEKKYYWLKLKNDFFTDKRIKKLRKIAGGDTYTIIYLKMQLLSLQDGGNLYFDGVENTFEEEIALQIDEDIEDVKITIAFLITNGLLEQMEANTYELIETKSCIGKDSESKERVRACRERKALRDKIELQYVKSVSHEALITLTDNKIHYFDNKRYGGNAEYVYDLAMCKCEYCGETNTEKFVIHHNNGYSNDLEDLYLLCPKCHRNVEAGNIKNLKHNRRNIETKLLNSVTCNTDVTKCNIEIDKDKEKDIYYYIEQNFGRPLSPIEYELVNQWKDTELTRYAIKQAILNGKYNLKYINAILMNYKKNHILTIQEAQEEEMRFKGKTIINPTWLDKEIQSREATPEEEAEFIKELNEIDNS